MDSDSCRVCFATNISAKTHLNDNFDDLKDCNVGDAIYAVTGVNLRVDDRFSDKICEICLDTLIKAVKFKEQCEKSILELGNFVKIEEDFDVKSERDASDIEEDSRQRFVCDVCKKSFLKYDTMLKHITNIHLQSKRDEKLDCIDIIGAGKTRVFQCKSCDYKTRRLVHMRAHVVVHSGVKPFRCDLCTKAYTQIGSLQFHVEKEHLLKNLQVPCEVCGKMLSSKKHLWTHLKTHSDRVHECRVCRKRLKNEKTLQQHMARHSGQKNFSCERCAAAFYTFSELLNHKNMHKDEQSMFRCTHCDYRVKRKSLLRTHIEKHLSNRSHTCQLCGRLFANDLALKTHKAKHEQWKLYKCQFCAVRFSNIRTLKRHSRKVHNESGNVHYWKAIKNEINISGAAENINHIPVP